MIGRHLFLVSGVLRDSGSIKVMDVIFGIIPGKWCQDYVPTDLELMVAQEILRLTLEWL